MLSLITGLLLTVMAYSQSGSPAVEEKNKTVNEETVNTISRSKEEPKPMSIYGGLILYKVELESRTSLSPYAQEFSLKNRADAFPIRVAVRKTSKPPVAPEAMYIRVPFAFAVSITSL